MTTATAAHNPDGRAALAYAAMIGETIADVDALPWRNAIVAVFGYHDTVRHTRLGHDLECPATAGEDTTCQTCQKCFGHWCE